MKKNFRLILALIYFLMLTVYFSIESYNYFVLDKFIEGFAIIIPILMFVLLSVILLIIFIIKKDFKNLGVFYLFLFFITAFGFLGFKISLTMIPIISSIASLYFTYSIKTYQK